MENTQQITPPKEAPPIGKNYVFEDGVWKLVDNPVFNIVTPSPQVN